jgi:hypothetical protein
MSNRRKKAEIRLNIENIAPSGHNILHQGLLTKKTATKKSTRIVSLSVLGQAVSCPAIARLTMLGTAASNAPAGQNLQTKSQWPSPNK